MNLSLPAFLDIAIGLTLIYLILSLLASEIHELIAALFQFRAKQLKQSIYILLGGIGKLSDVKASCQGECKLASDFTEELYKNSLIASLLDSPFGFGQLNSKIKYGPSYIPSDIFAIALTEVLKEKLTISNDPSLNVDKIKEILTPKTSPKTENCDAVESAKSIAIILPRRLINNLCELATRAQLKAKSNEQKEPEIYLFQREIEVWFERSQNRTTGTYKRRAKAWLFLIGLITAFFSNANTFNIVSNLYHQGTVRDAVTQAAVNVVDNCKGQTEATSEEGGNAQKLDCLDENIKKTIESDPLPIGWKSEKDFIKSIDVTNRANILNLLGWIMSAFAIMMGAPFWFDLLNKFVNVRNAGPKPPSSTES
jgi:hypothetical protein